MALSKKHRKTLATLFRHPTPPDVKWARVEALIYALGGDVHEKAGSRVLVDLDGRTLSVHEPHGAAAMKRASVRAVRDFLASLGITPDAIDQQRS
ncbi:MAG: hypothetical protein AAF624_00525 [Bacteroidota bacterium]